MAPARALHDILAGLAHQGEPVTDPAGVLVAAGHGDLPGGLVAEAIVSYADTAPAEVAEHLAPFVTGYSAVALAGAGADPAGAAVDPAAGLALLTTAPVGPAGPAPDGLTGTDPGDDGFGTGEGLEADLADPFDLGFGQAAEVGEATAGADGGDFGAGDWAGAADPAGPGGAGLLDGLAGLPAEFGGTDADPLALSPTQPDPLDPEPVDPDPADPDPNLPGPDEPDPADPGTGGLAAG